jgi:hypothetical protein
LRFALPNRAALSDMYLRAASDFIRLALFDLMLRHFAAQGDIAQAVRRIAHFVQ